LGQLTALQEQKLKKGVFSRGDLPFMKRVAGWEENFARDFLLSRVFISDDFPTLERPINAISTLSFSGNLLVIPHTVSSSTLFIFILHLPLQMLLQVLLS